MLLSSPLETHALWVSLSQTNKKIVLYGELGAGKTTFTKWFTEGIGINPIKVQSPTYTYMNVYDEKLLHIDMYRLTEASQMLHLGLLDQIEKYPYVIIERAKRPEQYIDNSWLEISIEKVSENEREITISNP
jgi:tRNA threonylcarbamoyladenosine biosynthesis protein TsaE